MIGLIGAMRVEVEALQQELLHKKTETISGMTFYSGTLCGKETVIAESGIGKVFSALCAQTMILRYSVSQIINTGVGGTLTDRLSIGQIAIADSVVQHDMDTSPLGDPPGLLSGINKIVLPADREVVRLLEESVRRAGVPYQVGTIASGDRFVASVSEKERISSQFHGICCEMEGGAIGHACYINGVPFGVLRAISDDANGNSPEDFPAFTKQAVEVSLQVIRNYLSLF